MDIRMGRADQGGGYGAEIGVNGAFIGAHVDSAKLRTENASQIVGGRVRGCACIDARRFAADLVRSGIEQGIGSYVAHSEISSLYVAVRHYDWDGTASPGDGVTVTPYNAILHADGALRGSIASRLEDGACA